MAVGYVVYKPEPVEGSNMPFGMYFSPVDTSEIFHVDPKTASLLPSDTFKEIHELLFGDYIDFTALAKLYATFNKVNKSSFIDYLNTIDLNALAESVTAGCVAVSSFGESDILQSIVELPYVTRLRLSSRSYVGHGLLNDVDTLCIMSPSDSRHPDVAFCSTIIGYEKPIATL